MSRQLDPAQSDRKLRPIYDCLDNGCYKKALQEIDKLLKKTKDWQYVKVLKALSLIRMGRQKEAMDILNDIQKEVPYEDNTLQTMAICFREVQRNDLIPPLYENALKKDATNEKLHTQLFMAYVRMQEHKKQQMAALNLFRVHPKNPYYFWAVMSIYMQALTTEDTNIAANVVFPLAEKMCQKFYDENKFEAEAELQLYLMILEKQNKYSKMIELINSTLGRQKLSDHLGTVSYRKVQLFLKEERYKEALDGLLDLVNKNNDQYDYYIEAFKVATLLDRQTSDDSETDLVYSLQVLALLDQMCTRGKTVLCNGNSDNFFTEDTISKRIPRAPFIARIIIFNLIKQSAESSKCFDKYLIELDDLLYDYFERFGTKFVCVKDILYMLHNIYFTKQQVDSLLAKIQLSLLHISKEESLDQVNRSLCYHYLSHFNREHFAQNLVDRVDEARVLIELQKKSNSIRTASSSESQKAKESGKEPFDPFVYLFINHLFAGVDIYGNENGSTLSEHLFAGAIFLENALISNKSDFYSKLLLVRIYNSLGAALSSLVLCESLEIKLIQHDTLGHFFLTALLDNALYSQAHQYLATCWKFYTFNFKEASDYITSCYKYGSFTKIEEIMAFNYKLRNSLQYHTVLIERLFLNLILECKNHATFASFIEESEKHVLNGDITKVKWAEICDTRDLQLLEANNGRLRAHIADVLKQKTLTEEVIWLRYRYALLHALVTAYHLSEHLYATPDLTNGQSTANDQANLDSFSLDALTSLVEQLDQLAKIGQSIKDKPVDYCLEGPTPSRLDSYFVRQSHWRIILLIFQDLLSMFRHFSNQTSPNEVDLKSTLSDVLADMLSDIEKLSAAPQHLKGVSQILALVSNLVEVISVSVSLLGIADSTIRRVVKSSKKSKKRKCEGQQLIDEQLITKFVDHFSLTRATLDGHLHKLSCHLNDHFESLFTFAVTDASYQMAIELEDCDKTIGMVKNNLRNSYTKSLAELNSVLQIKQKYLSFASPSNN